MALADLEALIQQCLANYDSTIDLTSGSPADVQVVQPILARLGTDPFTVDIGLFIQTTINQQFPDIPTKEGDAITDLLIKTAIVLWNPIVREITRVHQVLSFQDPTILTTDEAQALGANLFATIESGAFATGVARLYFAQAQNASVTPSNFVTSSSGLHFYPTEVQSIRVTEMLLNVENSLYYFDINVIAEAAGSQYNLDVDQLVSIANLSSVQRLTNKVRFQNGIDAETSTDFVGRIEDELTERSMVTERGIDAQLTSAFSEISQISVIGFNDPEMQRDLLTGGGLGPIIAGGIAMFTESDGENAVLTRRITTAEAGVDFTQTVGPTGQATQGFTLTVFGAFPFGVVPIVQDLDVARVVDAQTLDLVQQVLAYGVTEIAWTLRAKSLSLSGIPGGILFPNQPDGTVTVPNDQVHIGGMYDVYVRGDTFDSASLVLTDVIDDQPLLAGVALQLDSTTTITLSDFVLGTNYSVGDPTYEALANAEADNLSIQILDPPSAGTYRITFVTQSFGLSPVLTLSPALPNVVSGSFRWRISSEIFVDLVEPKETKISGSDLRTTQGVAVVDTASGVDFDDCGVGQNDILRITTGTLIVGDYTIQSVLSPLFTQLQVDRPLPASVNGAKFYIFRPNVGGGIQLPLVRIDSIALLDTSSQPVGSNVPYANPIDVQSNGFANVAKGIKLDVTDGRLGIVSVQFSTYTVPVSGQTIIISWPAAPPLFLTPISFSVTFSGTNPLALTDVVNQINAAVTVATGGVITRIAVLLDPDATLVNRRFGILPVSPNVTVSSTGTQPMPMLFGPGLLFPDGVTSRDIASLEAAQEGGWAGLRPALDSDFDVAQVVDGLQIGFYHLADPPIVNLPFNSGTYDPLRTTQDFNPEVTTHVQVGGRSLGTVDLYFLDPTSFEVDSNAVFTVTNTDGSELNFFPDPTAQYQRIPPLPSGTKPVDGETGGTLASGVFQSLSTDFVSKGILAGDLLVIDYWPLIGSVVLTDPVAGLAGLTLIVSINGGSDKTIFFLSDSGAIPTTAVTRAGVLTQINTTVGQTIASLTSANNLQFNPDASVIVRHTGTANTLLGFSTSTDQNNDAPDKGTYTVAVNGVGPLGNVNQLVVTTAFPTGATDTPNQQFKVFREGLQRVSSTQMATQTADAGLYYIQVELVSEGTGDRYNIAAAVQMTVTGFRSDGYYLTTDDSTLTFSTVEKPKLHLSHSILEVGVSDDPANQTELSGQNLQINYDQSSLTSNVNNFITSETERVINANPLGRHLIPYFVRFSMTYFGGSDASLVISDMETYIEGLSGSDSLTASSLEQIALNRGATSVQNPLDLIAVIHNVDRSITVERSQNKLNTGTLAAFVSDQLLVTRSIS